MLLVTLRAISKPNLIKIVRAVINKKIKLTFWECFGQKGVLW